MKRIILMGNITIVLVIIGAALISCSHPGRTDAGFGIYLVENGKIVLSDEHIKYYNKNTPEIELNEKGIKRWESYIPYDTSLDPPIPKLGGLYKKDFAVRLNGKEIYRGKFWSMASSMGCGNSLRTLRMMVNCVPSVNRDLWSCTPLLMCKRC